LFVLIDIASEAQGERRAELVRALLSRSLHSPLQLVCDGKDTTNFGRFQIFPPKFLRFVATGLAYLRQNAKNASQSVRHLVFHFDLK